MDEQAGIPRYTQFQTEFDLALPPRQVALAIPVSDWDGLIRRIEQLKPNLRRLAIAYSIFFGISVTAGLSIAPLIISGLPSWVVTLYAAICAGALMLGIGLLIAERMLAKRESTDIDLLTGEMVNIRDSYLIS